MMEVLQTQLKEGARAFQDYFGQVLDEKWYESPWLRSEWMSGDRQAVRTNAARIDCTLLTKVFPPAVSPFGNAVACLEEWMPFQLRTFQADEHVFEAVLTAEQRGSKERARIFSAMGREYFCKNVAEQNMLTSCAASPTEQTLYCTRYCDLTSEHYNKYYCLEKLKSSWFTSKKTQIVTVLGCLGVVNECLARAEADTMALPVVKERLPAGHGKLVAASFPLIGELALALLSFPPLHGKLFVFLSKATFMDLLPLLARHLERTLTAYFEATSVDLNPAVRCLCTVNVGQSSITVLFRDEKGENLLATVEVLFCHPEVARTLMAHSADSAAGNCLCLLREYFILKNVLSKPALWFATLLAVDVWHHSGQLAPNYKLSEHMTIWEVVVLSWILDEKSSDNIGTVFVRLLSTIELSPILSTSPAAQISSLTTDHSFDPFRFERCATKEKKTPAVKLSGFISALCGKQCFKFMRVGVGVDLTDGQKELYRRAQPVIRNSLIKGLKEDVASRKGMAVVVEKSRPLPVSVLASPLPSTVTMTPPVTPTVRSPVAAASISHIQPDSKYGILPVSPDKAPLAVAPVVPFSPPSALPSTPKIKVEAVEPDRRPPPPDRPAPLVPPPPPPPPPPSPSTVVTTRSSSPTPPRDPRCRPRYQGIPSSYQMECEQALKEQDFVRALLLKEQGLVVGLNVQPVKPSSVESSLAAALPSRTEVMPQIQRDSAMKPGQCCDRLQQGKTTTVAEPQSEESSSTSTSGKQRRTFCSMLRRKAERRNKRASIEPPKRKRRYSDDSDSDDGQRRLVIDHKPASPHNQGQEEGELEERPSSQTEREMHNPVDGLNPHNSVYVGEIRGGTGHARIKKLFRPYGCQRVFFRASTYHTNTEYAKINFPTPRAAALACAEMHKKKVDQRRLFVSTAHHGNELLVDPNYMGRFDVMLRGLSPRLVPADLTSKIERKLPNQLDDIFLRGTVCYLSFKHREDAEKFLERGTVQWNRMRCDIVAAPTSRRKLRTCSD